MAKRPGWTWRNPNDPWQAVILGSALAGGIVLYGVVLVPLLGGGERWPIEAFANSRQERLFDAMLTVCLGVYGAWVMTVWLRQKRETARIECSHREHQRRVRLQRLTRRPAVSTKIDGNAAAHPRLP